MLYGLRMESYLNRKIDRCDQFSENVEKLLRLLTLKEDGPVFIMSADEIIDVAASEHFDLAFRCLKWMCKFVNATCLHVGDVRISLDCAEAIYGAMGGGYRFVADCDDHIVTSKSTFDL